MRHSKETISFADHLILNYSKLDLENNYCLNKADISEFDLHELSALLLQEDSHYASETTGPDNESYEKLMIPALIKFLKNSTDKQNENDFVEAWKKGIIDYHHGIVEELLCERLERFNEDEDHFYNRNYEVSYGSTR